MKPNFRVCEKCKHFELNKPGYKLAGICNLWPKDWSTCPDDAIHSCVVFMSEPPDNCPFILEHLIK